MKNTWLKGLNERHVAAIERLQPYNGRDWMKTLREVSNPDKHQEITPAKGDISVIMFVKEETAGYGTLPLPAYRAPHPVTGVEVELKLHVSGSILFSDGAPVIETLEKLILKTSETLEAFKSEFNIG